MAMIWTSADAAFRKMDAFAVLATAIAAALPLAAAAQAGDARCKIVANGNEIETSLNAQITASGRISGAYVLEVTSPVDGRRLALRQARFDVEGADAVTVLDAAIKLPRGEGFSASLLVEWPGGSSSCSAAGS